MNILYMTIAYEPKDRNLYHDLVSSLLARGHSITLVRGVPNADGTRLETVEKNFRMLSVKTADPFSKNILKKGLSLIMLAPAFRSAIRKYLSRESYDLILYATPPVTLAKVVAFCRKKFHAKTFLMLKDIFPQNAVDLEMMKKGSLIYRYFRRQEEKYYEYSDYIGCMSQGNVNYVKAHNPDVDPAKLHVFANSISVGQPGTTKFNQDKTVFMFGGNLGKPQAISQLLDAALALRDYPKAEFVIVGHGTEAEKIQQFCAEKNLKNLTYRQYMPQAEYEQLLQTADVGLISLDHRFTIPNMPSRFQTYLKLSKPVLAVTDTATDLRSMIEENNCGWWCEAGNTASLTELVRHICEDKQEQAEKGRNGLNLLHREFDIEDNVTKLENFCKGQEQSVKEE